jgi:hypothetical protein
LQPKVESEKIETRVSQIHSPSAPLPLALVAPSEAKHRSLDPSPAGNYQKLKLKLLGLNHHHDHVDSSLNESVATDDAARHGGPRHNLGLP